MCSLQPCGSPPPLLLPSSPSFVLGACSPVTPLGNELQIAGIPLEHEAQQQGQQEQTQQRQQQDEPQLGVNRRGRQADALFADVSGRRRTCRGRRPRCCPPGKETRTVGLEGEREGGRERGREGLQTASLGELAVGPRLLPLQLNGAGGQGDGAGRRLPGRGGGQGVELAQRALAAALCGKQERVWLPWSNENTRYRLTIPLGRAGGWMVTRAEVADTRRKTGAPTPSGGAGPVRPSTHGPAERPAEFTAQSCRTKNNRELKT
ncbi:hypothetical protein EYF80_022617 [Liparis tanakae]|uniref:Uncharacterized protein n=1 Tax=Liparis tanakae TaxID=230148 RepID=A0A4Z2HNL8_9TELE|nr:hypothetical protein EYF80_022617 [Liparis tanakae]